MVDSRAAMKKVEIFTDGGAQGNPGPGGFGVILKHQDHVKEISGGFRLTTNNRMELIAAIRGLQALKERCDVTVFSDSQYLVNGIEKGWAKRWRANGWKRNKQGEKALNADLWAILLELGAHHRVKFSWVRGHAGHAENERCDELAVTAANGKGLPPDLVYEASQR
jgi:ribonuclease HI